MMRNPDSTHRVLSNWGFAKDVVSLAVLVGILCGSVLGFATILQQEYLQNGLFRLSFQTLQREWNLGILSSVVWLACAIGYWGVAVRLLKAPKGVSGLVVFSGGVAALLALLERHGLKQYLWSIDGVDGQGTITLAYVLERVLGQSRYVIAAAVGAAVITLICRRLRGPLDDLWSHAQERMQWAVRPGFRKPCLSALMIIVVFNLAVEADRRLSRPHGPNIILISIDTLRADRLGCYGYPLDTSPALDEFAANANVFRNCFAQSPWTLTSHMSMMTSRYPSSHGVDERNSLAASHITLAEVLRNEGYGTLGVARSCIWMDAGYGFSQGFDAYYVKSFGEDCMVQNRFIERRLEERRADKMFIFLHYFDVHSDFHRLPYDSPGSYQERFCSDYDGSFDGEIGGRVASEALHYANENRIGLAREELDYIASLYDAGVAYLDDGIRDLFEILDRMDLYDSSMIIVTSDHGEEFQEHGYLGHGNPGHHKEIIRVPLFVKLPGHDAANRDISDLVQIIDLAPSILEYLDVRIPGAFQGVSRVPLISGEPPPRTDAESLAISEHFSSFSVTDGTWRLLGADSADSLTFQLFHRWDDPEERTNRIDDFPNIRSALARRYLANRGKDAPGAAGIEINLTDEQKRRLRALGY